MEIFDKVVGREHPNSAAMMCYGASSLIKQVRIVQLIEKASAHGIVAKAGLLRVIWGILNNKVSLL